MYIYIYIYRCTHHTSPLSLPMPKWCSTTHCNTLQHTATHCNTLQHTATQVYTPYLSSAFTDAKMVLNDDLYGMSEKSPRDRKCYFLTTRQFKEVGRDKVRECARAHTRKREGGRESQSEKQREREREREGEMERGREGERERERGFVWNVGKVTTRSNVLFFDHAPAQGGKERERVHESERESESESERESKSERESESENESKSESESKSERARARESARERKIESARGREQEKRE